MDNTAITTGKISNSLNKQQKEQIKEKFKSFNKEFDEVLLTQKGYAIPDVELRAQVLKEVRVILCPMYNRFHDKYTTAVEFTRNPEKYIKYNKQELESQLEKLFNTSG